MTVNLALQTLESKPLWYAGIPVKLYASLTAYQHSGRVQN